MLSRCREAGRDRDALLDGLKSKNETRAAAALEAFRAMGSEERRSLLAAAIARRNAALQAEKCWEVLIWLLNPGLIVLGIHWPLAFFVLIIFLSRLPLSVPSYLLRERTKASEHAIRRLGTVIAEMSDLSAVPLLLDKLTPLPTAASESLTLLLPRMTARDARLLGPTERKRLYNLLKIEYARSLCDLQVAILKALGEVGDEESRPFIRELAEFPVTSPEGTRVRLAARECLPRLRARIEQLKAEETLLRPSAAPADSADTLLRPAGSAPRSDQPLLRPVAQPETAKLPVGDAPAGQPLHHRRS